VSAVAVRDLGFHFPDGTPALRDVSFTIERGECVGLIGPNGAGKSTLLLHLNGILPDGTSGHSQGTVHVFERLLDDDSAGPIRRRVGLLFQDPDDQLFCQTVGEDVAFGPRQLDLTASEVARRVAEALERVGLRGFERRAPHRLSGGQKKRACIAGLLAYDPELYLLDEPTAGLDPRSRRELLDVVRGLQATKVIATHDLSLVLDLCSRAILLDGGAIVHDGAPLELLLNDALMMRHGLECPRLDLRLPDGGA
jgi:energy-coupling factor transporter ATP-binding protein EcfA2